MKQNSNQIVLVTGGTGFLASHCILQLLELGYTVRTTVRSLERKEEVLAMLNFGGVESTERLSFYAADLREDEGWQNAISGCNFVLHVASPFPAKMPKDENELIVPASEGSLRVLKIAKQEKVRRVVLTSSFAAVGYGHGKTAHVFNETDWTDPGNPNVSAYVKSKTIAEQAAWEFVEKPGNNLELAVINPVAIFGPLLGDHLSTSLGIIKQLLDGKVKAAPKIYFTAVDVRDVADLHIKAMTHPQASGERFLACTGSSLSILNVAMIVKQNFGVKARKVPERELPNWLMRLVGAFSSQMKPFLNELGKIKQISNEKARNVLSWQPRSHEEAILSSAESILKLENQEK